MVVHVGPRKQRARWSYSCPFGTASNVRRFRDMPIEFYFTPELHLKDGRIIRDLEDAASFARESTSFAQESISEMRSYTS